MIGHANLAKDYYQKLISQNFIQTVWNYFHLFYKIYPSFYCSFLPMWQYYWNLLYHKMKTTLESISDMFQNHSVFNRARHWILKPVYKCMGCKYLNTNKRKPWITRMWNWEKWLLIYLQKDSLETFNCILWIVFFCLLQSNWK